MTGWRWKAKGVGGWLLMALIFTMMVITNRAPFSDDGPLCRWLPWGPHRRKARA